MINFRLPNNMDSHLRELLHGTILAFIHRIAGMGLGFLLSIVIARILGPHNLGLFALAGTCAMIATVLGKVGLDNAVLKFAATGAAKRDWNQVADVYRLGITIGFTASGITSVGLMILAPFIADKVFGEPSLASVIRIMAVTIVPSSLLALHGEMLKALKLTGLASLLQGSLPPAATFAVLGVIAILIGTDITAFQMAWISVVSVTSMLLLGIFLWKLKTPQVHGRRGSFEASCLIKTSLPLFWVSSLNLVMGATDTVMLGIWKTVDQVAYYGVATQLAVLVSFPLIAVNTIAAPKIAGLYAAADVSAVNSVARSAVTITVVMSLPVAMVYWIRPDLPILFYGSLFLPAAIPLTLLSLGHFVNAVTGPVGYLLMLTGNEKLMRNNIAGCSLLNFALNFILIPEFGIAGAAGATAASMATMNLISLLLVYRRLGIVPIPLAPQGPQATR